MSQHIESTTFLPHASPACANRRLLLFAIRRVAAGGLNDAHAAHAFFTMFGRGFRRPLVLLRAMMAEMSRVANCTIQVAPCCCPRMTPAEAILIATIADACDAPHHAHDQLAAMLETPHCLGILCSAQALAQAFADLGRPLATA